MDRLHTIGSTTPIKFGLYDAATGQIGQTGQTGAGINVPVSLVAGVGGNITVQIWQPGASAFAAATGKVVEYGFGLYGYIPVAADSAGATAADDEILLHITCPGCQTYDDSIQVSGLNVLSPVIRTTYGMVK